MLNCSLLLFNRCCLMGLNYFLICFNLYSFDGSSHCFYLIHCELSISNTYRGTIWLDAWKLISTVSGNSKYFWASHFRISLTEICFVVSFAKKFLMTCTEFQRWIRGHHCEFNGSKYLHNSLLLLALSIVALIANFLDIDILFCRSISFSLVQLLFGVHSIGRNNHCSSSNYCKLVSY